MSLHLFWGVVTSMWVQVGLEEHTVLRLLLLLLLLIHLENRSPILGKYSYSFLH